MVELNDYDKLDRLTLRTKREEELVRFWDNFSVGSINDCMPKAGRGRNENRVTVSAPSKTQLPALSTTQLHDIQTNACSIIEHVLQHGDIRLVRRCLEKVPVTLRKRKALIQFFYTFAPIAINDKGIISYMRERNKECSDSFYLCMHTPWWKCTK